MKYVAIDITLGNYSRKFNYRPGTSDEGVIQQIFIQEDYSLNKLKRLVELQKYSERQIKNNQFPLIVDAGANIGASTVYFALKHPLAKIIAIEPGAENYDLLSLNTDGLNVELKMCAVASNVGFMSVIDVGEGFWGLRTEAALTKTFGTEVPAVTVNDIYKEHEAGYFPYIAKIDIEGGEKELFSQKIDWVSKTPCIIIELHDWLLPKGGTSQSFLQCISQLDRDFIFIGENVFSIANNLDEIYYKSTRNALNETKVVVTSELQSQNLYGYTDTDLFDKTTDIVRLIERAQAQIELNRLDEAAETYRMALSREPNNAECLLRLSHVLLSMKCHEECLHHARHFLRLVSDVSMGYYLAGHAARELGRWSESRDYLGMAVELDPTNVYASVLLCMSSFSICMNQKEADSAMYAYSEELDGLIAGTTLDTAERVDNAVDGIGALPPFFLPYLGCNVKDLQQKYGSWICRIMAAKYPRFTQPLPQRSSTGRIKVGIVSHYFHNHSNWKIPIRGWLEQLDRQLFSIHCYYTGEISDVATSTARALSDSFLQNNDTEALAEAIFEQGLDVLIYPGIGMDTATLKLAALRLAPVQCASWGHPVTTGMPTVDYFISSDLMEPPDGDAHYSEKLVRLPNLSIWYEAAETGMADFSNTAIAALSKNEVIFLCCQNLLKYLPRYDFVFPAIAGRVRNARFVFIASPVSELTGKFIQRLELSFVNCGLKAANHITVVPQLGEADFTALNARADIFLDSIEWSGCNTVFESLPFNKPIVTMPGSFMRGRHAYAILKMMGVEETIAADTDEYVAIATRLALDKHWREELSAGINRNKQRVYGDRECIAVLERFLVDLTG